MSHARYSSLSKIILFRLLAHSSPSLIVNDQIKNCFCPLIKDPSFAQQLYLSNWSCFSARVSRRLQQWALFSSSELFSPNTETFFCPFCYDTCWDPNSDSADHKRAGIERGERGRDVWSEPSNLIHTLLAFLVQSKCCLLSGSAVWRFL